MELCMEGKVLVKTRAFMSVSYMKESEMNLCC